MSYSIYYRSLYIKVGDQFLPMTERGDNNCYETATGRRARDWVIDRSVTDGHPLATAAQIKAILISYRDSLVKGNDEYRVTNPNWDVYDDAQFGYYASLTLSGKHTSACSFRMYQKFFERAMKNARTVEETKAEGLSIFIREREKLGGTRGIPLSIHTTDDLIRLTEMYICEHSNRGFDHQIIGTAAIERLAVK